MKRYLAPILIIAFVFLGMVSCYHDVNRGDKTEIGTGENPPPPEPPVEPPTGDPPFSNLSLKGIKITHYDTSGSESYKDAIAFDYDDSGRLKLTTFSTNKEYKSVPLLPPLIKETFSYDDSGNLVEIFRQRGMSVNDVKEGGKQLFKYDESKRLSEEMQMVLFNLDKPLNLWKWAFNNIDPLASKAVYYLNIKPAGEEEWNKTENEALVKFSEDGLPISLKVDGSTSANYSFEYGEFGVDKMVFDGNPIRVYRDSSGKITHATLEGSKSCSIVEANEINDQNQIVKETWSYVDGGCLGWDKNGDRRVFETHEFTYEEVETTTSLPPLGLVHMLADTFTLYLLDEPGKLFGSFMYFYDQEQGLYQ